MHLQMHRSVKANNPSMNLVRHCCMFGCALVLCVRACQTIKKNLALIQGLKNHEIVVLLALHNCLAALKYIQTSHV
jgi:hypothetical protein